MDPDLQVLAAETVMTIPADTSDGPDRAATFVAMEAMPDGRAALLAWLIPAADRWTVGLVTVDLSSAATGDAIDLAIDPPTGERLSMTTPAPVLRASPDGRHAFLAVGVPAGRFEATAIEMHAAWSATLDGMDIGEATAAEVVDDLRLDGCAWLDYVTPDVVALLCDDTSTPDGGDFTASRWGTDGRSLADDPLRLAGLDATRPLIDQTNGRTYAWDAPGHVLVSVDLVDGVRTREISVRPEVAAPGEPWFLDGPPIVDPEADPVAWSDGGPGGSAPARHLLVGSPDGRWLFAAGRQPGRGGGSTGIWVFDAATFEFAGVWPTLAAYEDLTLIEGGRWLLALGAPGVTETGGPADWGVSLTVHDSVTGRPVRRIGDLGIGPDVFFHQAWTMAVTLPR